MANQTVDKSQSLRTVYISAIALNWEKMLISELLELLKTLHEQGLNPRRHNLFAYGGEIVSLVCKMTQPNSYRIISEKTYQELVNCATAIARHLDNRDGIERGVEKEFKDISEKAWNLDHDLKSGWHPDYLLPPKLPVGTITLVSEMASGNAPDAITMAMAIKAYPGVVVAYPTPIKESHAGYVVWSLVDAYAVTQQSQEYKDQWVLRRDGRDGGSHFWGFRVTYSELMKRKKELTIIGES